MKKGIVLFLCTIIVISAFACGSVSAYALSDGIYNAKIKTSYADPETGKPVDGGTNIALGDGMCKSIVEESMLIEQSNGKTYATIGLGLMSNVKDVKVQVQGKDGKYHDVSLEKVGSCKRNHDTCNHYRFEVFSAEKNISPILYVIPMGRNVQFFIIPDTNTIKSGTGDFGKSSTNNGGSSNKDETPNKDDSSNKGNTANKTDTTNKNQNSGNINSSIGHKDSVSNTMSSTSKDLVSNNELNNENMESEDNSISESSESSDSSSGEVQEALKKDANKGSNKNHMIWWIIGVGVVLLGGAAVWYWGYFKKKQ